MDQARYDRLKEVCQRVMAQPLEERQRAAEALCGGDRSLLREALEILNGATRTVDFAQPRLVVESSAGKLPPGTRVGQYTIVRFIDGGGMGEVYEAEGSRPHRLVAIKVLKSESAAATSLRRFEFEAEVLGRLQHAAIAQVYETGMFEHEGASRPFIAMQLVRGESVTTYARRKSLGVRERVELVRTVCEGVQYAHLNGIIHRDLKPSNILVEASGAPKVIDFGVARVAGAPSTLTSDGDSLRGVVGTLGYMAPEQAGGDGGEVDHRADVYALGVVLYELLAGRTPHDLAGKWLVEAIQIVTQAEAKPLSSLNRSLRGDLERIVMRALQRDRDRRYRDAASLADDLGRYLRNEPLAARPPSAIYVTRKFVRRHRLLAASISAAVVALVAGTAVASWQAQVARSRTLETSATSGVLLKLVGGDTESFVDSPEGSADAAHRLERPMLERLEQSLPKVTGFPRQEMALRLALYNQYSRHGLHGLAVVHGRRVLELLQRLEPRNASAIGNMRHSLANALGHAADARGAEEVLRPLIEDESAMASLSPRKRGRALRVYGETLAGLGRPTEGIDFIRRAILHFDSADGPGEKMELVVACDRLGTALRLAGEQVEAEAVYRRAMEQARRHIPPDHAWHAPPRRNLGAMLISLGRAEEAETLLREALVFGTTEIGEYHPDRLGMRHLLATSMAAQGKHAEAETVWLDVIRLARMHQPSPSHYTGVFCAAYASMLIDLGRHDEAIQLLREARPHLVDGNGKEGEYADRLWMATHKLAAAGVLIPVELQRPPR